MKVNEVSEWNTYPDVFDVSQHFALSSLPRERYVNSTHKRKTARPKIPNLKIKNSRHIFDRWLFCPLVYIFHSIN